MFRGSLMSMKRTPWSYQPWARTPPDSSNQCAEHITVVGVLPSAAVRPCRFWSSLSSVVHMSSSVSLVEPSEFVSPGVICQVWIEPWPLQPGRA